ncbi:MAG: hypothetical protein V4689_04315 [Verrucomicrobiota bacterium]
MKRSKRNQEPPIERKEWFRVARAAFPELDLVEYDPDDSTQLLSVCEDLADLANDAHQSREGAELVDRCYRFIRWSIRTTDDERLLGWISDWFFDGVLQLPGSKVGCLEYLDWGDVSILMQNFTAEPSFDDESNFEILCKEWKRRWARNQKLPEPTDFAALAVSPPNQLPSD